jgi:hypothetical protein
MKQRWLVRAGDGSKLKIKPCNLQSAHPAAAAASEGAASPKREATWEVTLSGSFVPFEPEVQRALEEAFRRGEASAAVTAGGRSREITLAPPHVQRAVDGEPVCREREVRRRV